MTPEFDKRSAVMFGSPYWTPDSEQEFLTRNEEYMELKELVQRSDTYDDLDGEMKEVYDRAEAEARVEGKKHHEFIQNDKEGYGRFHGSEI